MLKVYVLLKHDVCFDCSTAKLIAVYDNIVSATVARDTLNQETATSNSDYVAYQMSINSLFSEAEELNK